MGSKQSVPIKIPTKDDKDVITITILCDNSPQPLDGSFGEHGFAALIEAPGKDPILFDTGCGAPGGTLFHNATLLGKDLSRVKKVVLSHGHCDHTGGLRTFLEKTSDAGPKEIFAHPSVFAPRFFKHPATGEMIPIHCPDDQKTLTADPLHATFNLSKELRELEPGVFVTGEVPRPPHFDAGDKHIFADKECKEKDAVIDDQSVIIVGKEGIVLLLGCCHAGVLNTMTYAQQKVGRGKPILAVIGGTHLSFLTQQAQQDAVKTLKEMDVMDVMTGHCTGLPAHVLLVNALGLKKDGGRVTPITVGVVYRTFV